MRTSTIVSVEITIYRTFSLSNTFCLYCLYPVTLLPLLPLSSVSAQYLPTIHATPPALRFKLLPFRFILLSFFRCIFVYYQFDPWTAAVAYIRGQK